MRPRRYTETCRAPRDRLRARRRDHERVGITERAAHRIVAELADAGYITRVRTGRRNRYTVNADVPLPDAIGREHAVGRLLEILAAGGA